MYERRLSHDFSRSHVFSRKNQIVFYDCNKSNPLVLPLVFLRSLYDTKISFQSENRLRVTFWADSCKRNPPYVLMWLRAVYQTLLYTFIVLPGQDLTSFRNSCCQQRRSQADFAFYIYCILHGSKLNIFGNLRALSPPHHPSFLVRGLLSLFLCPQIPLGWDQGLWLAPYGMQGEKTLQ